MLYHLIDESQLSFANQKLFAQMAHRMPHNISGIFDIVCICIRSEQCAQAFLRNKLGQIFFSRIRCIPEQIGYQPSHFTLFPQCRHQSKMTYWQISHRLSSVIFSFPSQLQSCCMSLRHSLYDFPLSRRHNPFSIKCSRLLISQNHSSFMTISFMMC